MEYRKVSKPLHVNRVTIDFEGDKSPDLVFYLQAFYFGIAGEAVDGSVSSGDSGWSGRVVMDLDSEGERKLDLFLKEVVDRI